MFAQAANPTRFLVFAISALLGAALSDARTLHRTRATVCNGHAELCSRSFGNVSYVGAHDSYAVGATNIAANQDYNATQQLNDGIRMLQIQAHTGSDNAIHLCHTSCSLLDAGTLQDYLTPVKNWLDANPNEVVAILIVNIETLAPSAYASVYSSVGLDAISYSPPAGGAIAAADWPSLGSMIDSGKRVVTFMDFNANFAEVPYLIDEFVMVWETAFNVVDTFDCQLNRTGTADNKMYLINHFLDKQETLFGVSFPVPNKDALTTTNAESGSGSLGLQAQQCGAQWGKYPSFLLVDFYDYGGGSVFKVAASLNRLTYDPTQTIAPPITSGSTTGSGSSTASVSYIPNGAGHTPGGLGTLSAVTLMVAGALVAGTLYTL